MLETIGNVITAIDDAVWGWWLIILLLGTHVFMTFRTGFIQWKSITKGIKLSVTKDPDAEGEVSNFGALTTALAATIGTGNIVGVGTAVAHLTYVGDSDVGKNVNFGCGCVTVNYDGVHKFRCVIGDNAFIGCNVNLIAPVTVGDNTFIAAGSTITDSVPDRGFAIARSRQTTKENLGGEKLKDRVLKY